MPSAVLYLGLCSCEAPADNGGSTSEAIAPTNESLAIASLQDDPVAPLLGSVAGGQALQAPSAAGIISTCQDNSVDAVHVQVKACVTPTKRGGSQSYTCSLDPGYALVGGGAFAQYTGAGAFLTESHHVDARTWSGSSKDHRISDPHYLVAYAIGLRLDGVNADTLRGLLRHDSVTAPASPTAWPTASMARPQGGTSTGAQTNTIGPGQLLTQVVMDTTLASVASKDHHLSSPGTITASTTYVEGTFSAGTIIEGFGALEFQYMNATPSSVSTGIASSTANVSTGWALAGWGGSSTYTGGPGRLLFRIGPNAAAAGCNARTVVVQSKDHEGASEGTTTASWTQVRKVPGSHGLCNPGEKLSPSLDPCVAKICSPIADPYCCNNYWDDICVEEVTSICDRSCANYRCALPSWTDATSAYWNDTTGGDNSVVNMNNCYNFATNTQTGTSEHICAEPGRASGEDCVWKSNMANGPTLLRECVRRDGLLWMDQTAECPPNMDLLALAVTQFEPRAGGYQDYHFMRKDSGGNWSQKVGCGRFALATNEDLHTNPGTLITDPWATFSRGGYSVRVGYFCACSSATEGAGHSVIK
jgi:hypothetical protein